MNDTITQSPNNAKRPLHDHPTRLVMIGCGSMARHHVRRILQQQATTRITMLCEPSPDSEKLMAEVFAEAGLPTPPN